MTREAFDWLSPSVTQHVALALLHFLWQGTLVAIVLAVILRLLRDQVSADTMDAVHHHSPAPANTRANLRYAITCFGLLVMCVLPVVNLLVIEPPADTAINLDTAVETSVEFLEASREHHGNTTVVTDVAAAQSTIVVEPAIALDTGGGDAPVVAEPDQREAVAPSPASWAHSSVLQWFFWSWLVGVALLSAWHLAGWGLSQAFRRGGATPPDDVLALAGKIARRLGIRRAVVVRQTLKTAAPMVIGWIKPALVLPASILTGLAPRELEAVLAHELAHVRRHDYLVNLIQSVVETLLFYHPAVWWLSCRIRSEREFCADDLAMRICQRRDVYARSLVALAEMVRTPSHRAVAATGGRFLARIRRIMNLPDQRSTSPQFARRSALVAVMATACLGIALIAAAQSKPAKDKPLSGDADVTINAENAVESSEDREVAESVPQRAADLAPPVRITAGGEPIDVDGAAAPYLADFDGDGTNDLLVGQAGYGRLRIYRNTGTNARPKFDSFEWFMTDDRIAAVPVFCYVGFIPQLVDFDGDGRTDVLTGSFDGVGGAIYLFRRQDDGTFAAGEVLENKHGDTKFGGNLTVFVHDWDGDGDGDLLLGKGSRNLVPNEGTREQPVLGDTIPIMIDGEPIPYGVATPCVADWDGDGRDDLLAGLHGDIVWYRNTGSKGRPVLEGPRLLVASNLRLRDAERPGDMPAHPHAICVADFNGDGRLDLLLGDTYFVERSLDEVQRAELAEAAETEGAIRGECRRLIKERPENETREERIARFRRALAKWRELGTLPWVRCVQGDSPKKQRHGHVWLFERIAVERRTPDTIESRQESRIPGTGRIEARVAFPELRYGHVDPAGAPPDDGAADRWPTGSGVFRVASVRLSLENPTNHRWEKHDEAQPDASGTFIFEDVPAGFVRLMPMFEPNASLFGLELPAEVVAGETTKVTFGRKGRPLVGKVDLPEFLETVRERIRVWISLHAPPFHLVTGESPAQHMPFWNLFGALPESQRDQGPLPIDAEGRFRFDAVCPGNYYVHIYLSPGKLRPDGELDDLLKRPFTVPLTADRTPMDLGTLVVQAPDDAPEGKRGSEAADTAGKQHVPADDPKEEPNALGDSTIESLEGTWQAPSFRTSDEELNEATRTQSRSFSIVIAGDRFTWKYANGREKHWRFKISPGTDPKQIDFSREDSGTRRLGIYSLKQDELTICFSTVEPVQEGRRPTDFTAKEGSGRILMTVKRETGPDESKGSALDVRLIDPATGKPFSYGGVELTRTEDRQSPHEKLHASLSRDVFKFADLSPGRYSLHASVRSVHPHEPKYVADQDSPEIEMVAGEDKAISVRMRPVPLAKDEIAERWPYVTTGTVTDDQGKPIEGVDVYVYVGRGGTIQGWRGATTDARGNYTLRYSGRSTGSRPSTPPLLQGGSFRVWKDGFVEKNLNRHAGIVVATRTPQEQDWEQYPYLRKDPSHVVLPNQPHRIDFVMVSEVVIEGKLVDGQGVPLVKKRVHVTVNQDERLGSDFTDEQGDFQFKRIPPGRAVRFVVEHDRRQEVRSEPIVFERSGQSRVKLRLAIDAETGSMSLKIDSLPDPEAEASPEENGFRIDPTADTPEWLRMIALSRELPPIRSGHGQMTLMRVVLEDGDPGTLIQLTGTKLVLPERDRGGGGGDYRQIRSGDFVLVDHSGRARHPERKDPVKIGAFTHHRPTIWVPVPPHGSLGILGDVVIAPFPKERMGRIAAIAASGTEQPLKMSRICLGPLVVGGLYGKTLPFGLDDPFDSGRITPGVYKIQLPDFDRKESRWTVNVSPGKVTRLRFLARSQQVIEKTEEVHGLETGSESRKVRASTSEDVSETLDAKNPYSEVERFLTIAPAHLPVGCKLSEPRGALLAPKGVVLDRRQIAHVAAFFGIVDPLQLKEVQAAVTVVYEEAGARKGIEIGVYALSVSDGEAGKRLADRFTKLPARDGRRPAFIRKGSLVLHVWRDEEASDSAFQKICEYYRTTDFNWPKTAEVDTGHRQETDARRSEAPANRELIGEVFGRPVYRDEIRKELELRFELHRLFVEPVTERYKKAHADETELTEEEIQAGLDYQTEQAKKKGGQVAEAWQRTIEQERTDARRSLDQIDKELANTDLSHEDRRQLQSRRVEAERCVAQPGRFFVKWYFSRMKFQRHLYDTYGGGRVLFQQLGPEAFDAHHRWLGEREERGDFKIVDTRLRAACYEYWTKHTQSPWKGDQANKPFRFPWDVEDA